MSASDDKGWDKSDCDKRLASRDDIGDLKGGQVSGLTETLKEADSENSGWGARSVPKAECDAEVRLCTDSTTSLAGNRGRMVVDPTLRPRHRLKEPLAQCDESTKPSEEDLAWLNSDPVGRELL